MQPLTEAITKILAELIIVSALNLLPFRRLKSIDGTLKLVRADLRRVRALHGQRLDQHERRIDLHDRHAGIDTHAQPAALPRPPARPAT